jgi:hypothetical protein
MYVYPGSLLLAMNDQDSPLARRNEVSRDIDRLALKRQNACPETPKSQYNREPKVLDQKVTPLIHNRQSTIDLTCSTGKKDIQPPIFRDDDNDDVIASLAKNFRRQSFQPKNPLNYNEQDENKKPLSMNISLNGSNGNTAILSHTQKSTSLKNYYATDGEKSSIDSNCDRNTKKNGNFQKDLCDNDSRRTESICINKINNTDHNSSAHVHNNYHINSSSKCGIILHDAIDIDISLINTKHSDCSNNSNKISTNNTSNRYNINDKSRNITSQPHLIQKLSINEENNNCLKADVSLNAPQNHDNRSQPSKVTICNITTEKLDIKLNTKNGGGQLDKLLIAADLDSVLPNGKYSCVHIYVYVCIYMYRYIYIHLCICMYMYTYIMYIYVYC